MDRRVPVTAPVRAILFLAILLGIVPATGQAGTLDRVRKKADKEPKSKPAKTASKKNTDHEDDHEHESASGTIAKIVSSAVSNRSSRAPSERNRRHDHRPRRRTPRFGASFSWHRSFCPPPVVQHVHIHSVPPSMPDPNPVIEPIPVPSIDAPIVGMAEPVEYGPAVSDPYHDSVLPNYSDWNVRLALEYAVPLDDVSHVGSEIILRTPSGWGLDTRFNLKFENWDPNFRDHLWTGDVNLTYDVLRLPNFHLRAGLGVNWLADSVAGEAGLNLMMGSEWRPHQNVIVSSYLGVGTVGDADLFHGRLTTGYVMNRAEVFTGIDHYQVGGEEINTLLTGLRFRF